MTVMPAPTLAQQPFGISNEPGSGPSVFAADPTASLREAALLTLKSRRRKLGSGSEPAGIPPRPQAVHVTSADSSIQLDYGQEEPSGAFSTASSVPNLAPPAKPATPEPKEDDSQGREEGEISDSESTPASPLPQPKVAQKAKPTPAPREVGKPPTPAKALPIKTTPASSTGSTSSAVSTQSPSQLMPPPPPPLPYLLDETHVRPGLEMTQAQYDTAKDIVLDLLGWGVGPEYLVSCGVSREIMFYVFTELNLRLPPNFDVTGIPPYPPAPTDLNATPTTNIGRLDSTSLHPANGHANPQTNGQASSSQTALSATAAAFVPGIPGSSSAGPNLFDMEQQRRQELLARKAAIASRKKQAAPSTSTSGVNPIDVAKELKDVEMADALPANTVDDFLKSIDPVPEKDTGKGKAPTRLSSTPSLGTTTDAMDVDEVIPGLSIDTRIASSVHTSPSTSLVQTPTTATTSPVSTTRPKSAAASVPSTANLSPQSIASSSGERSPVNTSPSETETVPGLSFDLAMPAPERGRLAPPARRGTKRPVAADFDDDTQPHASRPRPNHGNGSNSNPYHQSSSRRNTGTFSGLSNMRRCVIDLSDSEEEEEEEEGAISSRQDGNTSIRPTSSRGGPQAGASVARQSPPGRGSATPTRVLTPAALQEKEEEIRKMRELIAQREQNRLRKLAVASRSTPTSTFDAPAPNGDLHATAPFEEDTSSSDGTGSNTPTPLGPISTSSSASVATSSTATPIDVISSSLFDSTAGDQAFNAPAFALPLPSPALSSVFIISYVLASIFICTFARAWLCGYSADR
ncbi:uncharacterized protein B0H18DRAFT_328875 [Fomitopsis serialis]|uniref:uncharacterized protein n=1 Tax=Fomitopsis serialis TaxID=139415 RepID=UPI00200896BD|nr:uncharacterized protein B0H18DRAFT_328875 [Neoantrodia serialis]KAH9936663.1 hypothetical protein B0H18DRAFT_328875 [Neoantrodia serialis]